MRRVAPYDLRLAARTVALSVVALCVVALIEWITDERGVGSPGTGGRSIGILPLTPVAAAIAVAIALAPAQTSGELRALAALGAPPWRARAAAMIAAASLSLFSAIAILSGAMDVNPLFPPPSIASDWHVERGDSATSFLSQRRRARVGADDLLVRAHGLPPEGLVPSPHRHRAAAAAFAVLASGLALALWLGSPLRRRPVRTLLIGALYGATQVAAFQSAGAGAISAFVTVVPPLLLLTVAVFEHRRASELPRDETWL